MMFELDPVIGLCLVVMAFATVNTWWVLRPFERARREQRAQKHAAE